MKPTTIICKVCGQAFVARDPRRMYCSAKCNGKVQAAKVYKARTALKPIPCVMCGTVFQPDRCNARFCTEKCHYMWNNAHRSYPHICKGCGAAFTSLLPRTKYCSRSCALTHTVVRRTLVCMDCGKTFDFVGRTRKRRCDACNKEYWNSYYHAAEDGLDPKYYRENHWRWRHDSTYRRIVRALPGELRYKYRNVCYDVWPRCCAICGSLEDVEVHHVDGDRKNFIISNLVPLCKAHHSAAHKKPHKMTWSVDDYKKALFEIWPLGRQILGAGAKQFANRNIANSVNALPVMGRANTELGSQEPSVETIHDAPAQAGEELVQTANHASGQ